MVLTLSSAFFSIATTPYRNYDHASTLPPYIATRRSLQNPGLINISSQRLMSASSVSSSPGTGSSTVVPQSTMEALDEAKVYDLEGNAIPISDLWKDRKAVIAFARHFGCVFCRKRADYLATKKEIMDAAGVALVLIGPGSVDQAREFTQKTKFKGEIYADPNHSSYDALNFVSGVTTTFTPSAGLKLIQLYMEGYRQNWKLSFQKQTVEKGGWQQGGLIVAGPGKGNILYVHKDKEAGDDPPVGVMGLQVPHWRVGRNKCSI